MLWAVIRLEINEDPDEDELTDEDVDDVDIDEAVVALEEQLPELPKGATWRVNYG